MPSCQTNSAQRKSYMKLKLKSKKAKFVIGGVLILGIVAYMAYAGIRDTRMYYMTPSEVIEMQEEAYTEQIRLGGIVADGSIQWDAKKLLLTFQVVDDKSAIPVFYQGVVPDTFENGVEIVVEGTYSPEGRFEATTLLPKCPSKYEPAD